MLKGGKREPCHNRREKMVSGKAGGPKSVLTTGLSRIFNVASLTKWNWKMLG